MGRDARHPQPLQRTFRGYETAVAEARTEPPFPSLQRRTGFSLRVPVVEEPQLLYHQGGTLAVCHARRQHGVVDFRRLQYAGIQLYRIETERNSRYSAQDFREQCIANAHRSYLCADIVTDENTRRTVCKPARSRPR